MERAETTKTCVIKREEYAQVSKKIRKNERMLVLFADGVLKNKDHRYTIDKVILELWKYAENSMDWRFE